MCSSVISSNNGRRDSLPLLSRVRDMRRASQPIVRVKKSDCMDRRLHQSCAETCELEMQKASETESSCAKVEDILVRLCADPASCVIVSKHEPPFAIVACSQSWSKLCGYSPEDAVDASPGLLQGELTDLKEAASFVSRIKEKGCAETKLVNYTKLGRPFIHCLSTTTVTDDTGAPYFVTVSYEEAPQNLAGFIYGSLCVGAYDTEYCTLPRLMERLHADHHADDETAARGRKAPPPTPPHRPKHVLLGRQPRSKRFSDPTLMAPYAPQNSLSTSGPSNIRRARYTY
jgi:hypothetical protein